MKWKQFFIYFAFGIIIVLCPIVLKLGWRHRYSVLFILVGTWFLGESFSILSLDYGNHQIHSAIPRILIGLGSLLMILSLIFSWFETDQQYYGVTMKYGYNTNGLTIGLAGFVSFAVALFKKVGSAKSFSLFCTFWGAYILMYLFSVYGSLSTSAFIAGDLGAKLGIGPHIALFGVLFVIVGGVLPSQAKEK